MKQLFLGLCLLMACSFSRAQEKWDLQQCVLYALNNNISVKQADVQSRLTALQVKLNEAGQIPNVGFSTSAGYNFGRSINPRNAKRLEWERLPTLAV